jgi:curved DNA-binding protein
VPLSQPQIDFDPKLDYYAALGVTPKATGDDIKHAYRKLARQYHPDATGGDKSKEVRFKDVQRAYDVLGDHKKKLLYDEIRAGEASDQRGVYTWQDLGIPEVGALFEQFFSDAGARSAKGASGYNGRFPRVEDLRRTAVPTAAEIDREVQASDGTWLRVDGADVFSDVRISFDRAIGGTTETVATIAGETDIKIPPGTSSGKKLRLRGRGITDRSGHCGDHYVVVQIDVPRELDERAMELLEQLVKRLR